MRRPQGYAQMWSDEGHKEWDTRSCAHCGKVDHIKPMTDPADMGGLCKVCMGLVCPNCVGKGCDPNEEQIRRLEKSIERDLERRRSYG